MATRTRAVCVGESMAVLLPDRPGPLETVGGFRVSVGGAESNVACTLAALGVPSAWVSRVGDDGFGRRLTAELAARAVDTSAVVTDPDRPTGVYFKESLGAGHSRLHYYRRGSAASAMGPDLLADPATASLLAGADLVHLTGITPALSDSCLDLVRTLMAAPRAGRLVSFDLNWRPLLWRDRDREVLPELMNAADVLLVGADEAEAACGTGDVRELRSRFPGPSILVVKDAGRQATAVTADGTVTVPALRVEVVEPTGAGDAFAAGYLGGLLRGLDQLRSLRMGHLCAAAALSAHGDVCAPPSESYLQAMLDATDAEWAAS